MANTVSLLSYANTFGDWVVTTNALTKENNNLASNNYVKSTGTLFLSDPILGLQVGNNAIIAGQLQVQGIGSSAYIQNNLRVDTQVYFQNTTLGLTNSGQAIIGGLLSANGSSIGLAVANNTTIGGYLRVTGNSSITGVTALGNTLSVVGATTLSNTLAVTGATSLSSTLGVIGATTLTSTLDVTGRTTMGSTLNVASNIIGTDSLTIKNLSNTGTLIVGGAGSVGGALSVSGSLSVSGNTFENNITANSTIYTPILNATNYATVNGLTSNTIIRTTTSNISGTEYVDTIVANTSITVPTLTVTSAFSACNASLTANTVTVGTGGLSVIGNFTLNGTTVYNTPTLTLSAGTSNQDSFLKSYRSPGANAAFKWDNANVAWYVADVNTGANSYYYRVLSTQQLTDSVSTANSILAASATAVKTVQDNLTTANTSMKSYVDTANTSLKSYTDNIVTIIQGVDVGQNSRMTIIEGTDTSQNVRLDYSNTAITIIQGTDSSQNARMTIIEGTDSSQNARMTIIEGTDSSQNSRMTIIEGVDSGQNTRMGTIESSVTTQTNNLAATNGKMQSAFDSSNTKVASVTTVSSARIAIAGTSTAPTVDLATAGPGAGSATNSSVTIDAYGRVTALASGTAPVTSITGTANQIIVTGTTTPTLSTPQSIGTTSTPQFGGLGVGTAASATTGEIRAINNITAYYSSDKKFKENVQDIPNALETVGAIGGKLFDWTDAYLEAHGGEDDYFNQKHDFGVIAQDVQSVFPRAVRTRPDGSLAVDYEKLVAIAFAAIKELSREIEELKKK